MVNYCVCGGCTNSSLSGHRVHRFPDRKKNGAIFRAWVRFVQLKRRDFSSASATKNAVVCGFNVGCRSKNQVRLTPGAVPSVPTASAGPLSNDRLRSKPSFSIRTLFPTSKNVGHTLVVSKWCVCVCVCVCEVKHHSNHVHLSFYLDHGYALPTSPTALKTRINEALARVESLEREKKNAVAREKRPKTTVKSLLEDLREKNLINEELKERLKFYSGKTKLAL
uniref:THAP-type domain-containing protein n=1 Tax=Sparus aurata TaxID=8175 RepID=A0A671TXC6_SPAAU